jgi:hypothetical protein
MPQHSCPSPMSSSQTSGCSRMKPPSSCSHSLEFRSMTSTPALAQPVDTAAEGLRLTDHHRTDAKLQDQAAAVPARGQCGDHDGVLVRAPPPGVAKGIRLPMYRWVTVLNTAIVTAAEQPPGPVKERRADGDTSLGQTEAGFLDRDTQHCGVVSVTHDWNAIRLSVDPRPRAAKQTLQSCPDSCHSRGRFIAARRSIRHTSAHTGCAERKTR